MITIVGTLGRIAEVPPELAGANITQSSARLRLDSSFACRRFLKHFLNSPLAVRQYNWHRLGTGVPRLNIHHVWDLQIPLPSLSEQKRIAGILDQADGLRRKRQQALCDATDLIQSLLFDFTGQAINAAVRPLIHNTSKYLPHDFVWRRLDEITLSVQDIDHNMPKSVLDGVPFISAKDLTDDGELSFADVKRISRDDYLRLSRKVKPQRGDVIYSRIGARLGKARLVNVDFEFLASYSCCTIRPNTRLIDPVFLTIYLQQWCSSARLRRNVRTCVSIAHHFALPTPHLPAQSLVMQNQEQLHGLADLR